MKTSHETESVLDSVGAAEAPGDWSLRQLARSFLALIDRERIAPETRAFAREILRILAGESEITISPADPRFRDPAWTNHRVFRRIGQVYAAFCDFTDRIRMEDGPWTEQERARLFAEVLTSTLAPTNLLFTNPVALQAVRQSRGRSLLRGARNFIHDVRHNGGFPSQVDRSKFKVGKNLAATPGAVVFRNPMLEIIEYKPRTASVYEKPLLIVSPQINRYYFLDISPGRSFVEYAVSQGVHTFMVSWRNPAPEQGHWNMDDYCESLLEAIDAVCEISGSKDLNTFGFCAGGITMFLLLAHMAASGDDRVNAACSAVTLLDLSGPALVGALNSKPLLRSAARRSRSRGVLKGRDLAKVFTWLRPNDLIWNYWVNNYLLGKSPPSFDILAWNADGTNLPAALHEDFIQIFRDNPLPRAGEFSVLGTPVDLSRIGIDTFLTGAIADHLTPWKGCYQTTQLLGGESTFVLSSAGHIASLINPPPAERARYWTGGQPLADPEKWLESASQQQGSWWEYWQDWISKRSGRKRRAPRRPGSAKHRPLAPAPGTYVFQQ